jgi:predicted GIY-YIG superfamily endonuclease
MSYVYCLATLNDPVRTYIGATVDLDRRLAQHNGVLVGGAHATSGRGGEWYRVCHVRGFVDWREALSFEWHWKRFSKGHGDPLTRRRRGLDACLEWSKNKELIVEYT